MLDVRWTWQDAGRRAGLIALCLLATAWARPLMLPDEGRYVGVAWEMLRSGEWGTPTLDGLPYFHKPPLFYWITAGAMSVFGPNAWAARAAPVLGACLAAFALHAFARRWAGLRMADTAAAVLVVQPLFYVGGQFANLDMLVAGCITATTLLLAHAALCAERQLPHRGVREAAYAMAALGVLAKGLIGAVLPALVVLTWLLARRRGRELRTLLSWRGALLFVAIAGPWFLLMQRRFPGFLDYIFVVQHFKRFASGGFNNVQPFGFFAAVLAVFTLPWLPWLRPLFARGYFRHPEQGPLRLLMLVWLLVVVVFFSLPQSKLVGYVLPAVPPLVYLVVDAFQTIAKPSSKVTGLWRTTLVATALVSLAAVAGLALYPKHTTRELAATLGAHKGPAEPVFVLHDYYFDVPFYARLRVPVQVVEDWSGLDLRQRDDWRRELADAARFAPAAAQRALFEPAQLQASLCLRPVSWAIGPASSPDRYAFLRQAQVIQSVRGSSLWRIAPTEPELASALGCARTPNDDLQDR